MKDPAIEGGWVALAEATQESVKPSILSLGGGWREQAGRKVGFRWQGFMIAIFHAEINEIAASKLTSAEIFNG